jgi:2-phosphosulfolactate phosphatase
VSRPSRSHATAPTDVGATGFDPWPAAQVHVEWGPLGARLAAQRGDFVVVVDVLSFSTTLTVAVEREFSVLVYDPAEIEAFGGRESAALRFGARPAQKSRRVPDGEFSLSPQSLLNAEPRQRLLLTSLNGAAAVSASACAPAVYVGGLRNGAACARLLAQELRRERAKRVTIVACGELWASVAPGFEGFRPSLEDWVGAGYLAGRLADEGYSLSPEAAAAVPYDERIASLTDCVSARELVAAGWEEDVAIALELDASAVVAVRDADDVAGRTFRGVPA